MRCWKINPGGIAMQVNLSGSTEKSIERRPAASQFDSPEEVIRAAIGQLD